jgi:hypothetical protein
MNGQSRIKPAGILLVVVVVGLCFYAAYTLFFKGESDKETDPKGGASSAYTGDAVEIGVAYGTEKQRWLESAVRQFASTPEGKLIKVNLIPKGSIEATQAILSGDKSINVWSPASALYKDVFVQEWQLKNSNNPILKEENLALTPMVFVMWRERYQEFVKKYQALTFKSIGQALAEKSGWAGIAQKPEWGVFKFGHTHPQQSNSGLATLVLMAADYHNKSRELSLTDILNTSFQTWMQDIERGSSGLSNSTGNMMREMVLKGPSSFDVICVYENVAIDYLKNAQGRWGELRIVYPKINIWNDNPYYVLDVAWSSDKQKKAAEAFMKFLLSEPIQQQSLPHGFRPGNLAVPILTGDSPFVAYQQHGLQVDLGSMCEAPRAEVLMNLLAGWQRSQGRR